MIYLQYRFTANIKAMCKHYLLLLLVAVTPLFGICQIPLEKELIKQTVLAKDVAAKSAALSALAEFYTIYRADRKADSVLTQQLELAEVSNDTALITAALFGNALNTLSTWSGKETFDRAIDFVQKGLDYAKRTNLYDLQVVAYIRKANLFRKRKLYEQATQEAMQAFAVLDLRSNDSLKTRLYIELGDILLAKGDIASAYTHYNRAFDISYDIKNFSLQSETLHHFADLYASIQKPELRENSLNESLTINTKHNNRHGVMLDYIHLFRATSKKEYLDRATIIADSLKSIRYQLFCKKLNFHYLANEKKAAQEALDYLSRNQDLYQSFIYQGRLNYYIGTTYQYSGQPELALKYYLLEEPLMVKEYDPSVQNGFFIEIAQCYNELKQTDKAIEYYQKAYALTKPDSSSRDNAEVTYALAQLYAQKKEYQTAFEYNQLHFAYSRELNKKEAERDLALMAYDREKLKHEKDIQEAFAADQKKREAQYLGMSIATVFLFIILIIFGMFPVSKTMVRMLNFVAFICLFEFIILVIDNWLGAMTHHEPLKMWLAKIIIIGMLLPLHHSLEHVAIRFLSSEKLIRFRKKISLKKLFHPSAKTVKKIQENLEESTLV